MLESVFKHWVSGWFNLPKGDFQDPWLLGYSKVCAYWHSGKQSHHRFGTSAMNGSLKFADWRQFYFSIISPNRICTQIHGWKTTRMHCQLHLGSNPSQYSFGSLMKAQALIINSSHCPTDKIAWGMYENFLFRCRNRKHLAQGPLLPSTLCIWKYCSLILTPFLPEPWPQRVKVPEFL